MKHHKFCCCCAIYMIWSLFEYTHCTQLAKLQIRELVVIEPSQKNIQPSHNATLIPCKLSKEHSAHASWKTRQDGLSGIRITETCYFNCHIGLGLQKYFHMMKKLYTNYIHTISPLTWKSHWFMCRLQKQGEAFLFLYSQSLGALTAGSQRNACLFV